MLKAIFGLLLLAPLTLVAQGWLPMGARSNSMANSSVTLTDVWSFHHNPGAMAELEKQAFGVSYENRFLLKELQSQGLVYGQPLKKGVLSIGAQTYGFKTYRTNRVGVGYSMKLSEKFSAGVQLNYQNIRLTENYGSKNTVTAEVGILAKITEKWSIGVSAFNLGRNKLADFQDDRFTTLMRLGTSYKFSKKVLVTAEAEKNVDFPLRAKAGIEYQLVEKFYLRGGFATQPIELSFGFGYKFSVFQLDFGSAYHQQLGWSPHFSFTYQHK
ncbi:MAG: hypothetical protein RI922_519 [Bacteroidota bacterium]|jgi:hypothetical protein